jgi:nucleoside-diphosphate-sugar epimerase
MRYLVTGGRGFLGSHLCEALLIKGHEVICLDSGVIGSARNVKHLWEFNKQFIEIHGDVLDNFDFGPLDGIFHLASPTAPAETYRHPELTFEVNSRAVVRLIEMAQRYGADLLFTSSTKVKDSINFGSDYIRGKLLGEKYCCEAGFPKIARLGNVYGPRMAPDDSRVIPTFLRNIRDGKPLSIWGDGQQQDSFCYVSDVIRALISFMDRSVFGVIEIGSPEPITIHALAVKLIQVTGIDTPICFDQPGGPAVIVCNNLGYENNRTCEALKEKSRKVPDISTARRELHWSPCVSLEKGVLKTFEYYKELPR